jgi:hypothetical protein
MNKPVIIPSSNELNVSVPKKRLKSQQVKKLTEEWSIEDSNYRVSLEISPRDATCANTKVSGYRRKIKKGTPRYNCTSLTSMPAGFELPKDIITVGNSFLHACWYDCTSLE